MKSKVLQLNYTALCDMSLLLDSNNFLPIFLFAILSTHTSLCYGLTLFMFPQLSKERMTMTTLH